MTSPRSTATPRRPRPRSRRIEVMLPSFQGHIVYPFSRARHRANLRKYVALNLPVDEIAYFDIDMVMLIEPKRLFGHIEAGSADFVYFADSPEWVYRRRKLDAARKMFPDMRLISAGAFVISPRLLTMDEPSEGLAPAIIESLVETFKRLEQEGLAILLIEQNLGVATSLAERQLVMVAGTIAAETTASQIATDPDAQRRYLGVEPLAE